MKKLLTLSIIVILSIASLPAQIGLFLGYANFDAEDYSMLIDAQDNPFTSLSTNFKQGVVQFGVDYWFRLPNKRIEFLPEFSFFQADAFVSLNPVPDNGFSDQMTLNAFQFNFNTHIYPFDFAGDCDCPTFSKDGEILKKGFFIRLGPGLSVNHFKDEISRNTILGSSMETLINTDIGLNLRAGIGLDIGLSDFITITPIAQYTHSFPTGGFSFLNASSPSNELNSVMSELFFGLRLGLRFDEINKYGYR